MIEIVKKKGLEKPRLVHNKILFWIIILLGILLIVVIIFIVRGMGNNSSDKLNNNASNECVVESDCVPVCGCHPSSCTPKNKRPECEGVFCTQECSGPLDCGAGSCGCVNGKCSVVNKKE
jgi:hypothetical protein